MLIFHKKYSNRPSFFNVYRASANKKYISVDKIVNVLY